MRDATGRALAYVYARDDATIARQAGVLTMDEARRIAALVRWRRSFLGLPINFLGGRVTPCVVMFAIPQSPRCPAYSLRDDAGGTPSGVPATQRGVWGRGGHVVTAVRPGYPPNPIAQTITPRDGCSRASRMSPGAGM